jgi:hypothetical protein
MKRRERRWVSRRRVKGSASSVCSVTHGLTCVSLMNSVVRETANKRVLDTCENMFHTSDQPRTSQGVPWRCHRSNGPSETTPRESCWRLCRTLISLSIGLSLQQRNAARKDKLYRGTWR